jgi:hypothetical protein
MFRSPSPSRAALASSVRTAEQMAEAALGAAHHLGAGVERNPLAALAWLTRARGARSKFANRFYFAVRDGCTDEQRGEAERRAGLSLGVEESAP